MGDDHYGGDVVGADDLLRHQTEKNRQCHSDIKTMATNGVMREERPLGRSLFRKIGRWLKEYKSLFKAYLIFVLFTVIAFAVILTPWCDQYILQPMNIMTASASAWLSNVSSKEDEEKLLVQKNNLTESAAPGKAAKI